MRLTRYLLCVPAWLLVADAAIATQTLGAPAGVGTSALPIAGLSLLGVAAAGLAIGIRIVRRKRKEK
jgi:hypothetical protein